MTSTSEPQEQVVVALDEFTYKGIPETDASLPSRLTFFWMSPMFRRAAYLHRHGQALQHEDLLPLPKTDYGATVQPIFDEAWDQHNNNNKPTDETYNNNNNKTQESPSSWSSTRTLRKSLWSVIGPKMIGAGFVKFFNTVLQFGYPLLLNAILKFIEDMQDGKIDESEENRGYWLGVLLFCIMAIKAMTENLYFQTVYRAAFQTRVAVSVAVYEKALRMANSERQGTTLGELVNLMQVDATKIEMFIPQFHVLWDGLLQIAGYMTILFTLIGWPCLAGLLVMIFSAPVQTVLMGKQFALNRHMVQYTDTRVKTTNEALQGIRCVKMYSWEESFVRMISRSRNLELGSIKEAQYLRGFSRAYMEALPGIVAITSFIVYALATDNANISASTLFAALTAFDQLRFPLLFYPMTLAQLAQAAVSAVRVEKFLQFREIGSAALEHEDDKRGSYSRDENESKRGEIQMEDATIYWQDPDIPIAAVSQHSSMSESGKSAASKKTHDSVSDAKSVGEEHTADVDESESDPVVSEEEPIKNYPSRITQSPFSATCPSMWPPVSYVRL